MQSDPRIEAALAAVSGATGTFRAALGTTLEQVQRYVTAHSSNGNQVARLSAELGQFAAGRINAERFASLFAETRSFDPLTLETIEQAAQTLAELAARGNDLFATNVPTGGCVRSTVAKALGQIGRVFVAARVVGQSQAQPDPPSREPRFLEAFPFRSWGKLQRLVAPPLVVHVDGGDLQAGGLAEFLDGSQKLVLVVRGESPPAPLARLITPGVFVMQAVDPSGLTGLAAYKGPGVAALVPEGAVEFVHDPGRGPNVWQRLSVTHLPPAGPVKALGGISAAQQAEEVDLLRALATTPVEAAQPVAKAERGAAAAPDEVEKLASWLISQAELE